MSKFFSFLSLFLPLVLIVCGLFMASVALRSLLSSAQTLECFCPSCEALAFGEKGADGLGLIKVDVQGAVKKPGVYQLKIGQRVSDLLSLSGGFLEDADRLYVAKTLNLATELKNQDKIYIPFLSERSAEAKESEVGNVTQAETTNNSLISINQADLNQLKTLSGIGDVKAQAIVSNRPYSSLEELVSKKVISESLLSDLRSQMSL